MTGGFLDAAFFDQAVQGIAPVLLAARGGTLCERVGLFNIALEGQMMAGAFGDAIIIGISLNLLASGLTSFLLRVVLGSGGTYSDPSMAGLARLRLPGIADLPLVGEALGHQNAVVFLCPLLVVLVAVFLARTPWGLRLRGIGENPVAAVTLRVNARRTMLLVTLVSGKLSGLAGLQVALGNVTLFAENMSAGAAGSRWPR